ncbi:hypothetical protein D3C59_35940 [Streptomyces sp. SHP22-7]|nr:hypothetical protein D3C59_35940 [Streptomyces sp. SHP22-7]
MTSVSIVGPALRRTLREGDDGVADRVDRFPGGGTVLPEVVQDLADRAFVGVALGHDPQEVNDLVGEVVDLGFGQFPDPVGERVEAGGGHGTAGDVHQPVEAARERGHLGCELRMTCSRTVKPLVTGCMVKADMSSDQSPNVVFSRDRATWAFCVSGASRRGCAGR